MSKNIINQISKYLLLVALGGFSYFGGAVEIMECDGKEFDFIGSDELECNKTICLHITYVGNNECEVRVIKRDNVDARLMSTSMGVCEEGGSLHEPVLCDVSISQ